LEELLKLRKKLAKGKPVDNDQVNSCLEKIHGHV